MKTISIVGAGWLGLPLGEELVKMGYQVTGTTTRTEKLELLVAAGMQAKILSSSEAAEADYNEVTRCDILIVTAPPRGGEEVYAAFLQKLSQAAKSNGVQHLIYTSATSVYPEINDLVTEKDAQMIVSSHSGTRLLAMENSLRDHFGKAITVVRFGGLFGPGRNPARWMSGRENLAGADSPVNMIHLDDCIGAIKAILAHGSPGETYNAVSPIHPTRREFYARACAASGLQPPQWNTNSKPWKKVSPEKLINDLRYSFTYTDSSRAF